MNYLLQGIMIGLGLNLLLGPIFFIITQTAIDKGVRSALMVCSGIWISDVIFAFICFGFLDDIIPFVSNPNFKVYLGLVGGLVLMFIGAKMIYTNTKNNQVKIDTNTITKYSKLIMQGFLVNTINPFSVFFWVGVSTSVLVSDKANWMEVTYFLIGVLGIIVLFDLLKVLLAEKIRKYLTRERMSIFNKYVGIIFIGLGIVLMVRSYF